jgi:hypothetical protein
MTEHKHLKRLVRQRMARTGESYTTALRHVAADRSGGAPVPRPAAVLPGYDRFGGGVHRESALLSRVLRQAGITASEAMLAGLGGGIGFMYFVFEYKGHHPMMTIVTQAHPDPMIPAALDRAGIEHEVKQTGSPRVAERNLRQALESGRVAICRTGHEVAVVGIDGDTVYVDDRCVEPCPWPMDRFMAAWSGVKKDRHHMITVTGAAAPGIATGAGSTGPGAGVAAAIKDTAHKLTGGGVLGNNFDVNFGLSGMRKFAAQLGDTDGKQGWVRRFADPEAYFIGMTRLHDCLELEYGSPGATRPVYADFLDEAGGWDEAAELYRRAGAVWTELADRALAEDVPEFARYRELMAEREELLLTGGRTAAGERLGTLAEEAGSLAGAYAATDSLGPEGRRERIGELAAIAGRALEIEERAAALLLGADG